MHRTSKFIELVALGDGSFSRAKLVGLKALFALYVRFGISKLGSPIKIRLRFAGQPFDFYIVHTFDLDTLYSVFVRREFEIPDCDDVRHIVDLGANIGAVSMFYALSYPNARVYAVEPLPIVHEQFKLNVGQFGIRIILIDKAISDSDGRVLEIRTESEHHLSASLLHATGDRAYEILTVTLRTLMTAYDIGRIDILKFNIEGMEYEVFESLQEQEKNGIRYIIGEVHPDIAQRSFNDFVAMLSDRFTVLSDIRSAKDRHFILACTRK